MRRVTRPGGIVAACTWDREGMETGAAFWQVVISLDPAAKQRSQGLQYAGRVGELAALWKEAGLESVEEGVIDYRMNYRSFADYWSMFDSGIAVVGGYVATLDATARDVLREALRQRVLGSGEDRAISMKARALVVKSKVSS